MWTNKPELELNFYKKVGLFLFLFFATIWSIVFWIGEYMPADPKEDTKKKVNK